MNAYEKRQRAVLKRVQRAAASPQEGLGWSTTSNSWTAYSTRSMPSRRPRPQLAWAGAHRGRHGRGGHQA